MEKDHLLAHLPPRMRQYWSHSMLAMSLCMNRFWWHMLRFLMTFTATFRTPSKIPRYTCTPCRLGSLSHQHSTNTVQIPNMTACASYLDNRSSRLRAHCTQPLITMVTSQIFGAGYCCNVRRHSRAGRGKKEAQAREGLWQKSLPPPGPAMGVSMTCDFVTCNALPCSRPLIPVGGHGTRRLCLQCPV